MRRALFIVAILIILIGIGVAAYFYFFAGKASIMVAPTGSAGLPIAGQGTTASGTTNNSTATTSVPISVAPRLVEISAGPIAPGEVVVDIPAKNASSSPSSTSLGTGDVLVNYIERQSGNVFSYSARTETITRTSDKTIPGIQSAQWLPDASVAFVRYLSGDDFSTINTYALPANGNGGFFLPQDIADISVSSTSVLTLASGVNGSVASTEHLDGTHSSQLFTTPLSEMRISFAGKNQYLAFSKPSSALSGDAFLVNATGRFSRIAGPLDGLVALSSHSGKWILISYTLNSAMQMELVNTATNETIPLPVATIADKCVWTADDSSIYCGIPVSPSTDAAYPDDWYQGTLQFSDRIWKIDVNGRFAQLVLDFPSETKETLDAETLAIDPLNTELVFMNKNDGSLWGYQL
jgi:hypothetical protein